MRTIRSLILVSSIAALAACGAISKPPSQPGSGSSSSPLTAPAFSERTLAAHVQPNGKPLAGCAIELSLPHSGKFPGLTDANGYIAWLVKIPSPDPGGGLNARVSIACPGFLVFEDSFVIAAEGNQDITFGGGAALGNQAMLRAGPEPAVAPVVARHGQVRLCGGTLCDDDGPLNALGSSLFWGVWGFENDRDRLETKNLQLAKDAGIFDFIRVFGAVGPGGEWADRLVDPTSFGYENALAGAIDLAYDKYGLRTELTIFAGIERTPTKASRRTVIERVARVVNERRHKVIFVEGANEGWQNGFGGPEGIAELRELMAYFKSLVPGVLTALTAPEDNGEYSPCAVYAGSNVEIATMHYDRAKGDTVNGRNYRAVRQAWGFPAEYQDKGGCEGLGRFKAVSNEPISQFSSVEMEKDPRVIAAAYRSALVSGNVAYVFHAGAGIRGGNPFEQGNSKPYLPRPANYSDDPTWAETVAALKASKTLLPAGAPSWQRFNAQWTGAPIKRLDDAVGAGQLVRGQAIVNGDRFQVEVLGIRGVITAQASEAMELDIVDGSTGTVLKHLSLAKDQTFTIDTTLTDVCLVGRFTSFALPKAA